VSANIYEREGRARKLAKLLDAVDAEATRGGLHPRLNAREICETWKNATGAQFARLVTLAKVNPPSSVTITEFFDALAERARAVAS
jgi:hypothetical protein